MAQWLQAPDGRVINFEIAKTISQINATLVLANTDGSQTVITYPSATAAGSALTGLLAQLQSPFTGPTALDAIRPSSGTHGSPQNSVLTGNGFAFSIVTTAFLGTVTIGVDFLSGASITYIDNNTLLLNWTPTNAGTFDVIYTASDGVTTSTLTAAFTAS
jgi:hypothetical protein